MEILSWAGLPFSTCHHAPPPSSGAVEENDRVNLEDVTFSEGPLTADADEGSTAEKVVAFPALPADDEVAPHRPRLLGSESSLQLGFVSQDSLGKERIVKDTAEISDETSLRQSVTAEAEQLTDRILSDAVDEEVAGGILEAQRSGVSLQKSIASHESQEDLPAAPAPTMEPVLTMETEELPATSAPTMEDQDHIAEVLEHEDTDALAHLPTHLDSVEEEYVLAAESAEIEAAETAMAAEAVENEESKSEEAQADPTSPISTAVEHLRRVEEELRLHREAAASEAAARQALEEQLKLERERAEVEAKGRRHLEQQIEDEKQRVEDERRRIEEEKAEAIRKETERRLEEELEHARNRAEEEARILAAQQEEKRLSKEKRRRHQELEVLARESAGKARAEREAREQAKAWLAAEGFRHVRAQCSRWSPQGLYPLHRAVQRNDPMMVRLLIRMGAEVQRTNTFAQTPLHLAKWKNSKGSHAAVILALTENQLVAAVSSSMRSMSSVPQSVATSSQP